MGNPANRRKSSNKGRFFKNPNADFELVRKFMNTIVEGPTVETFSPIDSTTNVNYTETNENYSGITRPTKEKQPNWFISKEAIFVYLLGIISSTFGLLVYNHGYRLVSIEKDIEYIKEGTKENKDKIEKVSEQNVQIDRKVDLITQKVDIQIKNNHH